MAHTFSACQSRACKHNEGKEFDTEVKGKCLIFLKEPFLIPYCFGINKDGVVGGWFGLVGFCYNCSTLTKEMENAWGLDFLYSMTVLIKTYVTSTQFEYCINLSGRWGSCLLSKLWFQHKCFSNLLLYLHFPLITLYGQGKYNFKNTF